MAFVPHNNSFLVTEIHRIDTIIVHYLVINASYLDNNLHILYYFYQMGTAIEHSGGKRKRSKAEAFRRIAERRTERVLQSLRLLGQCSNRRSYEYNDEQITKIFREIRSAVRHAEKSFHNSNKKTINFKL